MRVTSLTEESPTRINDNPESESSFPRTKELDISQFKKPKICVSEDNSSSCLSQSISSSKKQSEFMFGSEKRPVSDTASICKAN